MKKRSMPRVLPLLQGRVRHGQIYDEVRCAPLSGTVLEVGAGSGMWADVLATVTEGVKGPLKIYGVEPNPYSAAALRKRTRDVGLDGVYEVLPVGIEKLGDPTATGVRVAPGSVDCVVTIQCLCSIPEPEKNARLLYNYLKKGGRWYVYEHIKVDDNLAAISWFQALTNKIWTKVMGTCSLCCPTDKMLAKIGDWEEFDLALPAGQPLYEPAPRVMGVLTK
ncbi:hypothetical protein SAPIO_CDS9464 [Scedosporium apiospermum]|uniref:Methyltransferase type 11 domain-containing protein n=1 Tax=Pseudallescheria apiosperma TaxID=563466 RepID=A0A084FWV0_PSEDA|nr:uncharacterized protein SAPIO_CDS9464 [Scedosporium apiospermum]KEZ39562.1 hypothetical protein SAPIO_CDS9464 [Scedosporium apiospermum]